MLLQDVNTEECIALLAPDSICGDLLSITSSKGSITAEVATILGAQQFFQESHTPKRSTITPLLLLTVANSVADAAPMPTLGCFEGKLAYTMCFTSCDCLAFVASICCSWCCNAMQQRCQPSPHFTILYVLVDTPLVKFAECDCAARNAG